MFHVPRGALLLAFLLLTKWAAGAEQPPVILITIDTLRADHLPMWGASGVATPTLQALADRSVLFEQAVTTAPLTLPAHASLMTGTYPHFHQVRDNSTARLSGRIPTMATLLKRRGYETAAFVSSVVLDRRYGLDQGFDYYGDRFGSDVRYSGTAAERAAGSVLAEFRGWLESRTNAEPFFAWIHLYDPHAPYDPPESFDRRGYKGEIEYVDHELGGLFELLKRTGLERQSLILLLSDHGEDLDEHREPTHGFFLYDTVLRIPLLMKLPSEQLAGTRVTQQVRIIDVLPTVFQVLGSPLPRDARTQGAGLLSLALGKSGRALEAYSESLMPRIHFGWSALFSLRTPDFKLIEAPQPELYDLRKDPGEKRNLFEQRRGLGNQLRQQLRGIRSRFEGQAAETVAVDPRQQAKLQSLGYLSSSAPVTVPLDLEDRPDPKLKIDVYAEIYRGMQAFVEGDFSKATSHLERARTLDRSASLVHDYLGRTYARQGRPREAISSYRTAAQLNPGNYEISLNLATAYLQAGDFKEAESGFTMLTTLNESDWQSWHYLGTSRVQLGNLAGAAEAFQRAAALDPKHPDTLFNLGSVYEGQAKHLRAVEIFQRLVALEPGDPQAWNSLATNYEAAGLRSQSEEAYRKAIKANPDYAITYFNFGNLYARAGDWKRAESLYRETIQRDKGFVQAYLTLAVVLEQQGKREEADRFKRLAEQLQKGG